MNDRRHSRLVGVVTLLLVSTAPGMAAAGWRVLPATGFVADPLHIDLVHTIGGLWIRTDQNGDQFFVYQGVPIVEGDVIDAIALCYRADAGTRITAIGFVEFLGVGDSTGSGGHFDGTDLNSPTDTCYVSPVADYVPAGAERIDIDFFDQRTGTAELVAQDFHSGLAVLRISDTEYSAVRLRGSDHLRLGQEVFIVASAGDGQRRVNTGVLTSLQAFDAFWEFRLEKSITTTIMNPLTHQLTQTEPGEATADLTDDEIENTIAEIQAALKRTTRA